jgi:hypothetical protein
MGVACHLLKQDPNLQRLLHSAKRTDGEVTYDKAVWEAVATDGLQSDPLLAVALASAPIPDSELEDLLTWLRHVLLDEAARTEYARPDLNLPLRLYGALAQQCFINEYVFFHSSDEFGKASRLSDRLTEAVERGEKIPAVWVIAVACYIPLHSVAGSEKWLEGEWSEETKAILVQQIQEPLDELRLRSAIPRLTDIANAVSEAVQIQYEESPYPRWVTMPKAVKASDVNSYVSRRFPFSSNDAYPQRSCEVERSFPPGRTSGSTAHDRAL